LFGLGIYAISQNFGTGRPVTYPLIVANTTIAFHLIVLKFVGGLEALGAAIYSGIVVHICWIFFFVMYFSVKKKTEQIKVQILWEYRGN
jgi:hypothetical protein